MRLPTHRQVKAWADDAVVALECDAQREVRAIRQSGPTVRSLPAVLVKRLADHAGLQLGIRPALTDESRALAARLEETRRRRSLH